MSDSRSAEPRPSSATADAELADGIRRSLPPEHLQVETVAAWIVTAFLLPVVLFAPVAGLLFDWFPGWLDGLLGAAAFVAVGGLCWLARSWPRLEHRHTSYAVHPAGLDIWRGVLWRRQTSVPRSRVQHTDVQQGPLQRRFGLATLIAHTAGHEAARVELAGLRHADALCIRDFLLEGGGEDVV